MFRVLGLGLVLGFRVSGLGFGFWFKGFGIWLRVLGLVLGGLGFRVFRFDLGFWDFA